MLDELLYADDMDKNEAKMQRGSSEAKMQRVLDIKSQSHVITMISQSAQKDRGCTPTSTKKTVQ